MKSEHIAVELGLKEWVGLEYTADGKKVRTKSARAGNESGMLSDGQGQDCLTGPASQSGHRQVTAQAEQ